MNIPRDYYRSYNISTMPIKSKTSSGTKWFLAIFIFIVLSFISYIIFAANEKTWPFTKPVVSVAPSSAPPEIIHDEKKGICFGAYATDKAGCERVDGNWDYPCETDEECPYFSTNENYGEEGMRKGACMKGYCRLPVGCGKKGSTFHNCAPEETPLCYNCKEGISGPGGMGDCCKTQNSAIRNRTEDPLDYCTVSNLYQCLKSPDYVFPGDENDRKIYSMEHGFPKGISWDRKGSDVILGL